MTETQQMPLLRNMHDSAPQPCQPDTEGKHREFHLNGLDGSNPLGFLAAVGALKAVSDAWPNGEWKMRWSQDTGPWTPVLEGITAMDEEQLAEWLADSLKNASTRALSISKNLKLSPDLFRRLAQEAQESADMPDRRHADFIASFGCESVHDRKGQQIRDTAFRTMAGAGHQNFLESMLQTVENTTPIQLRDSLFTPWKRKDPRWGIRWDPAEDRRYALRWNDPSGETATTERGANRLAIESLALFPTAVNGATLETTGFSQERGRDTRFTWPIWNCSIDIRTATSTLRLREIQEEAPDHRKLRPLGIAAVYRSYRITTGNFRNFTPAVPV